MNRPLEVIEFGLFSGAENMAIDSRLLEICEENPGSAFLRFYGWTRWCISMGRFEPLEAIDLTKATLDGVEVTRRPTGGRAVMHGDDLTYAVVVPIGGERPDSIYRLICNCLLEGLRALGIEASFERGHIGLDLRMRRPCFASTSRYEITWKGKKLVGSAQRVGKKALLQHGSIPIGKGYLRILEYIRSDEKLKEAVGQMMREGTSCLAEILSPKQPSDIKAIADRMLEGFAKSFSIRISAMDRQLAQR